MSWFNESFSDKLNSIKGQITKITKEVLAEDDNENEDETESVRSQLKELDALCSSKDLEIISLREENKKISQRFQEELRLLRNENKNLKTNVRTKNENVLLGEDQIQQICELENELYQLRLERDHLEELQTDHQSNICLIMQQRDNCKLELEKLKADYLNLELRCKELQEEHDNSRVKSAFSDVNLLEIQNNDDTLTDLRHSVEKLSSETLLLQKEKEEISKVNETVRLENENLKDKIEKLMDEIKVVNVERENMELENCKLKETIHYIKTDLNKKNDDLELEQKKQSELEEKLRKLTENLKNNKIEYSNLKRDFENQVNKLLKIFSINKSENISLSVSVNEIESIWEANLKEKENAEKILSENIRKFENEIERLKSDKINLEHEIKMEIEKRNELECGYKKEINSLQEKYLELKSQEQDCLTTSQAEGVERLDEEVTRLMEMLEVKNKELSECYNKINIGTQEMNEVTSMMANYEKELLKVTGERDEVAKSLSDLKNDLESKEKENVENNEQLKEKLKVLENEKTELLQKNESLQSKLNETITLNADLKNEMLSLKSATVNMDALQKEIVELAKSKDELEKIIADMQQVKLNSDNQNEYLKAQVILKDSSIAELKATNHKLSEEMDKLKEELLKLKDVEEELQKWKAAMVELEMQRQELSELKEILEKECDSLKSQLKAEKCKKEELDHVKRENENLIQMCNRLRDEAQSKLPSEETEKGKENSETYNSEVSSLHSEIENLRAYSQKQANIISSLSYENNQLKHHMQLTNGNFAALSEENNQLKAEDSVEDRNIVTAENEMNRNKFSVIQQHRRSKSDFDAGHSEEDTNKLRLELENWRQSSQNWQKEYEALREQYALVSEKEAHSRRELDRLKEHLIEIENYYTETIDEYKTKLNVTEEQLKNSSTVYTSTKVRDNQHLESLQSQIRLISAQRDDVQVKLSAAEDEVQKHKAALTSFHVVLEQFQQDKEREIESLSSKYENQLLLSERRFAELQQEIMSLNSQLSDAKTGLKAASRLGEQLERKSVQITELEQKLMETKNEMKELEERATMANQSNFGKVDKSLVKNLLLGYISAQKGDRKHQVLRIMMSVLDFDEEERNKIGVDNTQSGWLSHLLHPRGDGTQASQSLSEAFIRFLENESRPQPQLKLLADRSPDVEKSSASTSKPQPSLLLQELVLPTFSSPQTTESNILKDVLNDT